MATLNDADMDVLNVREQIRQRGKFRTPGTFRTQVITTGTCPYLYLFYKKTHVKQYLNYLQP